MDQVKDQASDSNNSTQTSNVTRGVKLKTSTTSLASMAAGNWLKWKKKEEELERKKQYLDDNEDAVGEGHENEDDGDDYIPDDNGDEIDDHVQNRKKSWSFWNSNNNSTYDLDEGPSGGSGVGGAGGGGGNRNKDTNLANKILPSSPSLPSKPSEQISSGGEEDNEDDAVLYKPHDKPSQFKQINTHKNENLNQNEIVPSWYHCLPHQSSSASANSLANSFFTNTSTANKSNSQLFKGDISNWRNLINQLSTRLGFSSQSLSSVVPEDSGTEYTPATVEKEFSLLYERTYKLYGKSLAKLPQSKRACLPNYSKYYTKSDKEEENYQFQQQTQLEDDANDPNSISITNDPMGNLLINYKPQSTKAHNHQPVVNSSDIVSQKIGPLNKIKKILIIGVHGFFPTKMIRPLIGAPKGTSLKFANEAEKAMLRYCIENNLITEGEANDISIQKIALEKEGKIFDRVTFFTEILTKWKSELNDADFIFVASHSQGCVVSIMLLAKLIKMGILKNPLTKRIGILGMAGINNGPFYGVDKSFLMKAYSAIENESLTELFELTKFSSPQSLAYKESIQIIINANVKICFIGSINDQLVPLYSALASHVYHPNIYRACYIDQSSQAPVFIKKLVSLCCHLQNIGYFDNNVLKELSAVLAGPITGGGHSKIYNDGKVYDMGIKFVLDTDDIVIPPTDFSSFTKRPDYLMNPVRFQEPEYEEIVRIPATNQVYIKEYDVGKIGTNPFILPWCLRGLIFNIEKNWPNNNKLISVDSGRDFGKTGYDEIKELYDLFEAWKPDSKVLKDLKFRLNGIRASKL